MFHGKAGGDPAAKRIADEGDLWIAEGVQETLQVEDVCGDVGSLGGKRCFAEAGHVGGVYQVFFAQQRHQCGPDFGGVAEAMYEYYRGAAAPGAVVMHGDAAKVGGLFSYANE